MSRTPYPPAPRLHALEPNPTYSRHNPYDVRPQMDNRQSSPFGAPAFGGGVPTVCLRRPSAERRRSDQFDRLLMGSEPPPPHRSRAERLPSFQNAFGGLAGNRGAAGNAYQHGPYGPPTSMHQNPSARGQGNCLPYGGFDRPRDPFQLSGRSSAPGRDRAERERLHSSSRDNVYNNAEKRDLRRQVGEPWGIARLGEFQRARDFRRKGWGGRGVDSMALGRLVLMCSAHEVWTMIP